jgi:hypothetical protein
MQEETAASGSNAEEALAKYRKLLSVARNSLEANQLALAEKDKLIENLKRALESEQNKGKVSQTDDADVTTKLRRILRRLDIDGAIWLLFEYSSGTESWSKYHSEQEARDFVSRLPGEPLSIPHRCFTPEESANLV